MNSIGPYEYTCVTQPFWDYTEQRTDLRIHDDDDHRKLRIAYSKMVKKEPAAWTPAAKHPDRKWVMMKEACLRIDSIERRSSYCDDDNFPTMSLYTD